MKIGITGGSGFIGSYVVEELLSKGYEVVVFDRSKKTEYPKGVEVFLGDVTDEKSMREFAAHIDGMIHLAAVLGTQETIKYPTPAAITNLTGGLNFLEAISQYNIAGVYIAVGNWWMDNPYSITKNMIERFCSMYNKYRGTKVNIVRAVNAYGPRQSIATPFGSSKVRKITPAFICRALSGIPVEIYGDGSQVSDMVYVGDVAKALVISLEKALGGIVFDKPVEVGPVKDMPVKDTALEVIKSAKELGFNAVELKFLPMRHGENAGEKVKADTKTLKYVDMKESDLIPFEKGIRETVKWFSDMEGKKWLKTEEKCTRIL